MLMSGSRCRRYGRQRRRREESHVTGDGEGERRRVGGGRSGRRWRSREGRRSVRWEGDGWMDKVEGVDNVCWAFFIGLSSNFRSTDLLFLLLLKVI